LCLRISPFKFLFNLKYLSIVNHGYNAILINQWENINNITCPLTEVSAFPCVQTGKQVLELSEINVEVSNFEIILLQLKIFKRVAFFISIFQ
jgi:hypothetical protein